MNLCKEINGVKFVYSEALGRMVPKYIWAFDIDGPKFEWNEKDEVYYNNAENFITHHTALECGYVTEADYINAKIRREGLV